MRLVLSCWKDCKLDQTATATKKKKKKEKARAAKCGQQHQANTEEEITRGLQPLSVLLPPPNGTAWQKSNRERRSDLQSPSPSITIESAKLDLKLRDTGSIRGRGDTLR